ncbi:MAG: quinol:electron acceptor oxidoreductase subunit ActD, partial [Verrucomicrobiota bacterium]
NKPANLFTIPAFFPITFELTILFSAFTILFGLLLIIRLPRLHHPIFESSLFTRFSDDGFILAIESRDPKFSREDTMKYLEELGAKEVELVEEKI